MTTTVKVTATNLMTGETVTKKSSGWVSAGRAFMWAKKEAEKLVDGGFNEIEIKWF